MITAPMVTQESMQSTSRSVSSGLRMVRGERLAETAHALVSLRSVVDVLVLWT